MDLFSKCLRLQPHNFTHIYKNKIKYKIKSNKSISFANAVSELTRGGSTGASGKGHVKSASVSSPGTSVADSNNGAQQSDSLGPRYIIMEHKLFYINFDFSLFSIKM